MASAKAPEKYTPPPVRPVAWVACAGDTAGLAAALARSFRFEGLVAAVIDVRAYRESLR
jgi:hypothetical protein